MMPVMKESRQIIKINVPASAKKIVAALAMREDMTEQGVAGRIYAWFARQPELVQRVVLGQITEEMLPDLKDRLVEALSRPDQDGGRSGRKSA
jgi:hypothetical protein